MHCRTTIGVPGAELSISLQLTGVVVLGEVAQWPTTLTKYEFRFP